MSFFDEQPGRSYTELSAEAVVYYRQVMATHVNQPPEGVCQVCNVATCPDWRDAYDKLVDAGELMLPTSVYDNRSKQW